jgi:hypothetical protein
MAANDSCRAVRVVSTSFLSLRHLRLDQHFFKVQLDCLECIAIRIPAVGDGHEQHPRSDRCKRWPAQPRDLGSPRSPLWRRTSPIDIPSSIFARPSVPGATFDFIVVPRLCMGWSRCCDLHEGRNNALNATNARSKLRSSTPARRADVGCTVCDHLRQHDAIPTRPDEASPNLSRKSGPFETEGARGFSNADDPIAGLHSARCIRLPIGEHFARAHAPAPVADYTSANIAPKFSDVDAELMGRLDQAHQFVWCSNAFRCTTGPCCNVGEWCNVAPLHRFYISNERLAEWCIGAWCMSFGGQR